MADPAFLDRLDFHLEGEVVVLDRPLRYRSGDARVFTVPAGFRNDLASVPAWLRSLAPSWQQTARAGVLHDCLYRWFEVWSVSRADSDALFHEALRVDRTDAFRAWLLWKAVALFGGAAWKRWRRTSQAERGVRPPPILEP